MTHSGPNLSPSPLASDEEIRQQQEHIADFLLEVFEGEAQAKQTPKPPVRPNFQIVRTDYKSPNNGAEGIGE